MTYELVKRLRDPDTAAELDSWGVRSGVLDTRELSLQLLRERKEAADRLEALQAQVERVMEALRPFAKMADLNVPENADDGNGCEIVMSVRQMRRAQDAVRAYEPRALPAGPEEGFKRGLGETGTLPPQEDGAQLSRLSKPSPGDEEA